MHARPLLAPWAAGLLLAASPVAAQVPAAPAPPAATAPAADLGFCAWVRGQADSESALLLSPSLFARFGILNAGEVADSTLPLGSNALRLTVGLDYSGAGLVRGLLLRRRAEAECERYVARAVLERTAEIGAGLGARAALEARAASLAALLPEAQSRVDALAREVEAGGATVDELHALRMRLDTLRQLQHRTEVERESLRPFTPPSGGTLPALMGRFEAADGSVERHSAALRQSRAWDLSLRAGYDQVFGLSQGVPVVAMLTATFNPGYFWQPAADARALEGRASFLGDDQQMVHERLEALVAQLRTTLGAERARLEEVRVLGRDLASQLEALERLQTSHVRRFQDTVWFELAQLQAEQAYLERHVEGLAGFIEESEP